MKNYNKYNDLIDIFCLRLDSALKVLEVNQFHSNYENAFQRIKKYVEDVKSTIKVESSRHSNQETSSIPEKSPERVEGNNGQSDNSNCTTPENTKRKKGEENGGRDNGGGTESKKSLKMEVVKKPSRLSKVKRYVIELAYDKMDLITATKKLDDLRDCIEKFDGIKDLIPSTESFDILTRISDLKAASFWNKHFKTDECRYDTLKKVLPKPCNALECNRDELVSLKISMDLFNYVVSFLGGWENFLRYIETVNPFTKKFFKMASKEIKPPLDVDFYFADGDVVVKPRPTYWYDEDGQFSRQLGFVGHFRIGQEDVRWETYMIEPEGSLKLKLDQTEKLCFTVFSVLEDKGMISKEYMRVEHGPEIHKVEWVKGKGEWISPEEFNLFELPEKLSPIFEKTYKKTWDLSKNETKVPSDVSSLRPVIYASKTAYSLASKLGYFFSPEVLFSLWKDPLCIRESPFAKKVLQDYYDNEAARAFVYNTVLKYNNEFNEYIQMECPKFKWVPIYNEEQLKKVTDEFDCSDAFKRKLDAECMEFSKELALVISEYLGNKIAMNLCAVGAQSSIQGYLGSPNQKTLKSLKPGYIIVFNQSILGNKNTFISKANLESDSLTSLYRAIVNESLRLVGEIFYREIAEYIQQEKEIDIWKNPEAKWPVPSVFLPGQIPFSFIEKIFNVKPDDGRNLATVNKILDWMKFNPPRIQCNGTILKSQLNARKSILDASNGIEFYARGDFKVELKRLSIDGHSETIMWSIIVSNGFAYFTGPDGKYDEIRDFVPSELSQITYVGYRLEIRWGQIIFGGTGSVPLSIKKETTSDYGKCFVYFKPADEKNLDIINLHYVANTEEKTEKGKDTNDVKASSNMGNEDAKKEHKENSNEVKATTVVGMRGKPGVVGDALRNGFSLSSLLPFQIK